MLKPFLQQISHCKNAHAQNYAVMFLIQHYIMNIEIIKKAVELSEKGSVLDLYQLLKPFIASEDPFALYLFSTFSLPEFNETDDEFSCRSIKLKREASQHGFAEASYQMAVNHLYGDDVEQSYRKSTEYFELAVSQGHTHSKFTYGYSLYHGTNEVKLNQVRGICLLKEAAQEGSVGAKNELQKINRKITKKSR